MSKSVLVIDTPESCVTCPLAHYNFHENKYYCRGNNRWNLIQNYEWQKKQMSNKDIKPVSCPLSRLPSRKDISHYIQRGDAKSMTHMTMYIHDQGYNDCLDELLGEN